jgi:phosphatidylserine/phosphatidylglycerophosphate/cardiolipin synthase-like enzyme
LTSYARDGTAHKTRSANLEYSSTVFYADTGRVTEEVAFDCTDGFKKAYVETYSVDPKFLSALIDTGAFESIEIIFGDRAIFDQVSKRGRDAHAIAKKAGKLDRLQRRIVESEKDLFRAFADGDVTFYHSANPSHKKVVLLEGGGRKRAIIGSANFSSAGFLGRSEEALVVTDNAKVYDQLFSLYAQRRNAGTILNGDEALELFYL